MDVATLDSAVTALSNRPAINGILVMSVREEPLRVRVMFDGSKTDAYKVWEWLTSAGIPLDPIVKI